MRVCAHVHVCVCAHVHVCVLGMGGEPNEKDPDEKILFFFLYSVHLIQCQIQLHNKPEREATD